MIPVLFDPSVYTFNGIGEGKLIDTVSCKVIEELNGQYELEMTYPSSGRYFSEIRYSSIIFAKPFQNGKFQAFRIYKISKPMKGNVQIYARHISYQLNHIPCSPFSGQSCAQVMANIKTAVAEFCRFEFSTDITQNRTSQSKNLLVDLDIFEDSEVEIPEYSSSSLYVVGDYVKYTGKIYRCIIDVTTPGSWNTNKSCFEKESVPHVGYINAAFVGNVLTEDENAITVWIKCEKNKRYAISKTLSGIFRVGTMAQIPSEGKTVENIVNDSSARKIEYTTNNNAEFLLFYLYHSNVDGDRKETIVNSASIRTLETYSWMLYEPKCIRSFLLGEDDNSIQAIYGGEYEWDNYNVILHENRGSDKGIKIRYGKNLIDLTQEENIENTITGIYPIWKSDETLVELPEKVVHSANASNYPYFRTVVQDFSSDFDQMPTEEELREMATLYIQNENIGVPEVSLTVNFVNLSETEEYKDILALQTVNLGDLVTVEFPALDVNVKQKVSKTEYDVLNERYTSITIGNLEKKIDTTLEDQMNTLSQKVSEEEAQNKVDRATGVLNSGTRGHVIINRNDEGFANEIYFTDNQNVALAKNVLRINNSGIGFSSKGIHGPYYQAWTLDGHLSLGGVNNNHGTLEILDSDGSMLGSWDNEGVKIYKGKIKSTDFESTNGEFYVRETEDSEGKPTVEVGIGGWRVDDRAIVSDLIGWGSFGNNHNTHTQINPASGTNAVAALNGGDYSAAGSGSSSNTLAGRAAFQALWLDDDWFWGSATNWSYDEAGRSKFHLWDVAEKMKWIVEGEGGLQYLKGKIDDLDDRVKALEWSGGGEDGGEGGSNTGSGGDDEHLDDGSVGGG